MANSQQLRQNLNQHKPKNSKSKIDDKKIYQAMSLVEEYILKKFQKELQKDNFKIEFKKTISYVEMIENIKSKNVRKEFDNQFNHRTIKPDGGILCLTKTNDAKYRKYLLFAEVKRQGTNDQRKNEGKQKQAQGNAVERLGKNLIGIKAMMNHENITPFICFGWGCDFAPTENFVLAKVSMMNEFYSLNKIYVFKNAGEGTTFNSFSPVSMFFRERKWEVQEMFEKMKEIAETAIRYYIY